jgi:hypothetical protein
MVTGVMGALDCRKARALSKGRYNQGRRLLHIVRSLPAKAVNQTAL